ncbi:hypothetical protein, partial [Sphingomonas melonis]|uniref:hypothetical protein n=1 Tax=Sphingomonas melonis TaxID=152682 RepID=UPI001C540588
NSQVYVTTRRQRNNRRQAIHLKDPLCTLLQTTTKVETPMAAHYVWIREGHIERAIAFTDHTTP